MAIEVEISKIDITMDKDRTVTQFLKNNGKGRRNNGTKRRGDSVWSYLSSGEKRTESSYDKMMASTAVMRVA